MNPHHRRPRPDEGGGASSNSERAAVDGIGAPKARSVGLHTTFVDDMVDGIAFFGAIRDDPGRIVDFLVEYANQAFERLVERPHDELVGRRMLQALPTWADGLFDICVQAVETGQRRTGESLPERRGLEWANADGRTSSVEISISKLGDGCAISLRDVTARQRVEDELFRSQAMLRSVLDTFPQRVFWKDLNSTFVGCNAAFARNIGLADPSEIVGIDDFRIHAASDAEIYRADDREIMRSGMARIEYEEPMARTDGTDGWARTSKVPIRDKDGQVIGLLGAYQDITDQKQAREALRESERFLDSIVENIPDMIFVKDAQDLRFVRFNRAGEEMLGYTRKELIGKSDHDFFPQHEADSFTQRDREVLQGRQVFDIPEETIRTRHQGKRVLHTKKIPMLDERGNPEYLLGISEDVTERRRVEEEARTLNRELERQVLQYRMLLDQASDAIFVCDADRHYVDVNIAACALLGYSREELLRLSIPDVVPPEENPGQPERFVRMRAGEAMLSERALRRKDGSLLVAELSTRQLPDGRVQAIVRDITARRLLEKDQARLATAVEQADEAIVITDPSSSILYVNPSFERVSGYTRAELIGSNPRILNSGQHDSTFYRAMWSTLHAGQTWHGTLVNRRKDGSLFEEDAVITPIRDPDGTVVSYVGVKRDVTRERALEAQLLQSQKMQAVGQLAGGIAHDFNNLITAIRGYSEFVRESLPPGNRDDIDQVVLAADRAAELTRQLLAFSRRQVLQPRVLVPAEIVEGIAPMLRRLLGEHIELIVQAAPGVGRIRVDPTGLEQIIVNLAVNARDAMPGGGRLILETTDAEIDVRSEPAHAEMTPGPYVVLRVTDTGCGMDEATRARAFEPFFTTKEPGRGTGMGLATVYGIVRQSGGEINLYSELGQGTTFEIYLPRVDEEAVAAAVTTEAAVPRGTETIFLVEDEASVRVFARRVLEELGYTVLAASNGVEAAVRAATHSGRIDLLLTDVVMPRMGGHELAEQLRSTRPGLPIVFMSGFSGNAVRGADLTPPGAPVLAKPFTREGLGRAVRGALDAAE